MHDALGDRMKEYYEDRTRYKLMRRGYTIIRLDGKAFHSYTQGLQRPFDDGLITDMNETARYLCKNIMGCKLAYVQSDEISLVLTDFDKIGTQSWFDGNIQKMISVAASMATIKFNHLRLMRNVKKEGVDGYAMGYEGQLLADYEIESHKFAMFDARVFQVPTRSEAINYLIWRQQDATRNSIQLVAQSLYSQNELHGKKTDVLQKMIFQKGQNWNDLSPRKKRGCVIQKITEVTEMNLQSIDMMSDNTMSNRYTGTTRSNWVVRIDTPIFTQDKEFLTGIIPSNHE